MTNEQSYDQVVTGYVAQLRGLFASTPDALRAAAAKGVAVPAGPPPTDVLAGRAEQLVAASQRLGALTTERLNAPDPTERTAAELRLLAQASADLEAAQRLLAVAEETGAGGAIPKGLRATPRAGLERSLDDLAQVLERPLERVAPLAKAAAPLPADLAQASAGLQVGVQRAVDEICQAAIRTGSLALRDLLLLNSAALYEGVALVSKDAARLLDQLLGAVGGLVRRLVSAAAQLLASHPPERFGYRLLVMPPDEHFITLPLGDGPTP